MGITKADLDAQRAMIERGEEKRKAVRQQAERERLRDKFAAAALTGLLSNIPRYQLGVIAVQAYDIADEMLRERLRNGAVECRETVQHDRPSGVSGAWAEAANQQLRERGHYGSSPRSTTHDAVPEAKAASSPLGNPVAAGLGTGNTPEPVGWVLRHSMYGPHHDSFYPTKATAETAARMNPAWTLIPLFRSPTLADAEREVIELAISNKRLDLDAIYTLRGMLERLS